MAERRVEVSIWTPANIVTCVRIVLMPLWLLIAEIARLRGLLYMGSGLAWASFLLYAFIALTDKLDGYLARSRNEITDFGKFIDPIADKLSVTCALLYLMEVDLMPGWAVLLVVGREFLVSGLRMVVASRGIVIAASDLGKWKTATTMIAIGALLFSVTIAPGWLATFSAWLGFFSMVAALVLTAWSGLDYFMQCWPYVSGKK